MQLKAEYVFSSFPKMTDSAIFAAMRYKHFVLFWTWLAFSVVLGHNIVPHQHHYEQEAAANPGNFHQEKEESGLAGFFSHFAHGSCTTTITYLNGGHTRPVVLKKTEARPAPCLSAVFSTCEVFIPIQSPGRDEPLLSTDLFRRLPSRAPPLA